jgi:hypothetical protein
MRIVRRHTPGHRREIRRAPPSPIRSSEKTVARLEPFRSADNLVAFKLKFRQPGSKQSLGVRASLWRGGGPEAGMGAGNLQAPVEIRQPLVTVGVFRRSRRSSEQQDCDGNE